MNSPFDSTDAPSQPPGQEAILELQGLRKVFDHDLLKKREVAVEQLSMKFPMHRCTGLLGHNGAGKTTTMRMIFDVIRPDQGKVLFAGEPMQRKHRYRIGYMPEINKLSPHITPMEALKTQLQLYSVRKPRKERHEIITKLIAQAGLERHHGKRIGKLSKGLARRIAWAMAVIHDPELLILDEPFSGLDPIGRHEMAGWILGYKGEGKSIILCTHELETARDLCDEINILQQGRLVFSTVTPVADQVKLSDAAGEGFVIEVSGINLEGLSSMQTRLQLPTWLSAHAAAFLCTMTFTDYEAASAWLRACLEQGLIIVKFDDMSKVGIKNLLQYFRRS